MISVSTINNISAPVGIAFILWTLVIIAAVDMSAITTASAISITIGALVADSIFVIICTKIFGIVISTTHDAILA